MIIRTVAGKMKSNIECYAKLITHNSPINIKQLNELTWSLTFAAKIGWVN
jgi:hypothetical protein